jgi:peroxiredoxin
MRRSRRQTYDESNPYGLPAGLTWFADSPLWMTWVLWAAGIYTISVGAAALLLPRLLERWLSVEPAGHPAFLRYLGAAAAAYGVAYLLAAARPLLHWPVIFGGLLKNFLGPIVLIQAWGAGQIPERMALFVFINDIVWWIPFCLILYRAYQAHLDACRFASPEVQELALKVRTSTGDSLLNLAARQPLMLFFLRHTGCPFCRESLARLAQLRRQIEAAGTTLVLVYMSTDSHAGKFLSQFGLADVPAISDPRRSLYRAFGLRRGTPWQVAGPQLWRQGFPLLLRRGQSLSRKGGDLFQLSGLFLVFHGHVIRTFLHQSAGDMPDFLSFARGGTLAQDGALS